MGTPKVPGPPIKCGGCGCEECYGRSSRPCESRRRRLGEWADEHLDAWLRERAVTVFDAGAAVAFGLMGMFEAISEFWIYSVCPSCLKGGVRLLPDADGLGLYCAACNDAEACWAARRERNT